MTNHAHRILYSIFAALNSTKLIAKEDNVALI